MSQNNQDPDFWKILKDYHGPTRNAFEGFAKQCKIVKWPDWPDMWEIDENSKEEKHTPKEDSLSLENSEGRKEI